jgi:hypothetical protein
MMKRDEHGSKRQAELRWPPDLAGFLFRLIFDREDGGDMFLRNFGFSELHGVTILKPAALH